MELGSYHGDFSAFVDCWEGHSKRGRCPKPEGEVVGRLWNVAMTFKGGHGEGGNICFTRDGGATLVSRWCHQFREQGGGLTMSRSLGSKLSDQMVRQGGYFWKGVFTVLTLSANTFRKWQIYKYLSENRSTFSKSLAFQN